MKVQRITEVVARSEDGDELRLRYANRGEPYREGAEVVFFGLEWVKAESPWQDARAEEPG